MKLFEMTGDPVKKLETKLLNMKREKKPLNYDTIDKQMTKISDRCGISPEKLHDLFVEKHGTKPDNWIKKQKIVKESLDSERDLNSDPSVQNFIKMIVDDLKLKRLPQIEFSFDTKQAQDGHHTGRFTPDGKNGKIWIYAKNRNLVDILRTLCHELRHCKQREDDEIKPDSAQPGSPVEREADQYAGYWIKIFGKDNPHIFESKY